MILIAALIALALNVNAIDNTTENVFGISSIDKTFLDKLTRILNTNKTLDEKDLMTLNKTIRSLGISDEIVHKLSSIVSDRKDASGDNTQKYDILQNSFHRYEGNDESNIGPIEESPDYASSVVLASDLLSLTHAVANIKDEICREQGLKFLDGLLLKKRWALNMFDASAKSPQGLLFGSTNHLGNYDECVYIHDESGLGPTVKGQYCLATIDWPEAQEANKVRDGHGHKLRWAVCVPSMCNATTVAGFVIDIIANTIGSNVTVVVTEKDCSTDRPLNVDRIDIGYLSFILLFGLIVFISSIYHVYDRTCNNKSTSKIRDFVVSFSVFNNLQKILSTKQNTSLGLESVAGIKAVAMFFILFGHAGMFTMSGPLMNPEATIEINRMPIYALILNSVVLVDTFLMLSAFLFSRLLLIELDKRRGKLNIMPIFVFRYIRLTPAYIVIILLYMTWLPKIGDGPLWKSRMEIEQERCKYSWWANILYINNYVNSDKMCMFQSWYLSVDTQMFLVAPIFIFSLWRWRRLGSALIAVVTVISMIVPAVITYTRSLDATMLIFASELKDIVSNYYFNNAYIKTHMKMTPYFIGIYTGYIVHRIHSKNLQISKWIKIVGWIISFVLGTITIFSVTIFYQSWYRYSRIDAAMYISLHKVAWSIANAWLLIACCTGNGGIFQKFFSWKALMPISRLTYCAYLVNGTVELYYIATIQQPMYFSPLNLGAIGISHVILTFLLATILCVTFESPLHGIEKILLSMFDHRKISDNVRKETSTDISRETSQSKLDT